MPTRGGTARAVGAALVVTVATVLSTSPAAGDQGVARDVDEACAVAPLATFQDRPGGGLGDDVDCVAFYRVTTGTAAMRYEPGAPVTRGQMASFLVRTAEVAGAELAAAPPDRFDDDDGSTHESAIDALAAAGLADGYPDGSFRPGAEVTREQMASFLARLLVTVGGGALPTPTADFFADGDGTVHEDATNRLAEIGVVAGVASGGYAPRVSVSRGQMASFLARSLDWLTEVRAAPLARIGVLDVTAGPELVRVVATATSGSATTVTYTFDEPVDPATVSTPGFAVVGFDARIIRARAALVDPIDPATVRATFDAADARLATTATVAGGAVRDRSAVANPEGAARLQDIDLLTGTTTAPDLVSVSRLGAAVVDFNFDEPAFALRPAGYHLVLSTGVVVDATELVTGDGTTKHTMAFPLSSVEATRVVRGFVETASVGDAEPPGPGATNPQQAVVVATSGSLTGRPDLTTVAVDADRDQVRYTFDEPVTLAPATGERWRVYDLDAGETTSGIVALAPQDARTVVATFPPGTVDPSVSGASVDAGAVTSLSTGGTNLVDELGLARSFTGGTSTAPDLVRAGRVQQAGADPAGPSTVRRVVFRFDQSLVLSGLPSGFAVYDAGGVRAPLASCAADGRLVACSADSVGDPGGFAAIGAAARAGVAEGAVRSLTGAETGAASSAVL